ncbi:hypothetical protein [Kibdelosporangium philippinense]|uniref:hypothetical protein n=1 Tax=Kibdelosporangium philippinense TaxID=211113 RepID=UPI00360F48FB
MRPRLPDITKFARSYLAVNLGSWSVAAAAWFICRCPNRRLDVPRGVRLELDPVPRSPGANDRAFESSRTVATAQMSPDEPLSAV